MGLYSVINRALLQGGQPEDITQVLANLDGIAAILNGGIDPVNLRGAPALVGGETQVWNGSQYDRSSVTRIEPTSLKPSSYGITLPAAPYDGQEAVLVDSLTAPTYIWRFRYNAGSASAYKWEFVGGGGAIFGPLPTSAAQFGTSSASFVDLGGGPTFTAPRAGDYDCQFGVRAQSTTGANIALEHQLWDGSAAGGVALVYAPAGFLGGSAGAGEKRTFAALAPLRLQVKTAAASVWYNGWLSVKPVRVS